MHSNMKMILYRVIFSNSIQAKVKASEITEKIIDETRSQYIPVAIDSQILFFCVADMAKIDPMYQYSLEWFVRIFLSSIAQAERAGKFHRAYGHSVVDWDAAVVSSYFLFYLVFFLNFFYCC